MTPKMREASVVSTMRSSLCEVVELTIGEAKIVVDQPSKSEICS